MPGVDYRFFIVGSSHHHLYYLTPYIEVTEKKECCLINSPDKYTEIVKGEYSHINFRSFRYGDEDLIEYLRQSDFLVHANAYVLFEKGIREKLFESVIIAYVVHGVLGKFTDKGSVLPCLLYDIVVFSGRKDLDVVYSLIGFPEDKRVYDRSLILDMADGRKVQVILPGNLRVQNNFRNRPNPGKFFKEFPTFNPHWKTILYMPTYSYDINRTDSTYSSIPFFIKMVREGAVPDGYNYLLKLHPNMVLEKELLGELISAVRNSNLRFYLDVFGKDYLFYMDSCDLLITDRTSAFYDFLYFDKPVIFLDQNGECPEVIDFRDVVNSYWSYQCGPVVSEREMNRLPEIIEEVLENDPYKEIKRRVREYAFFDGVTPRDVLLEMLKHPKFRER